jgi:hypothetical protein
MRAEGSTHFHKREQTSFGACIVDRLRHGWRARPQGCGLSTMQAPKEVCVLEDKMLRSLTVAALISSIVLIQINIGKHKQTLKLQQDRQVILPKWRGELG